MSNSFGQNKINLLLLIKNFKDSKVVKICNGYAMSNRLIDIERQEIEYILKAFWKWHASMYDQSALGYVMNNIL